MRTLITIWAITILIATGTVIYINNGIDKMVKASVEFSAQDPSCNCRSINYTPVRLQPAGNSQLPEYNPQETIKTKQLQGGLGVGARVINYETKSGTF